MMAKAMTHEQIEWGLPAIEELAQLVEAIPAEFRGDLILAALRLEPSATLELSLFVGQLRAGIWNCLESRIPLWSDPGVAAFVTEQATELQHVIDPLSVATELADVRLVLADLLGVLEQTVPASRTGDSA